MVERSGVELVECRGRVSRVLGIELAEGESGGFRVSASRRVMARVWPMSGLILVMANYR